MSQDALRKSECGELLIPVIMDNWAANIFAKSN